jgi:hypothetical protein
MAADGHHPRDQLAAFRREGGRYLDARREGAK